ncbi:hypothetical protein STEG23_036333, partial [Scotinomys teguina]
TDPDLMSFYGVLCMTYCPHYIAKLFVETTDVSGKTLEGPVPLEVIVIDQNDNRPIFREGPYIGHVMEGSPT